MIDDPANQRVSVLFEGIVADKPTRRATFACAIASHGAGTSRKTTGCISSRLDDNHRYCRYGRTRVYLVCELESVLVYVLVLDLDYIVESMQFEFSSAGLKISIHNARTESQD